MKNTNDGGKPTPPVGDQQLFVPPYLPWFHSDWQGSARVRRLTLAQRGLYRELLDLCWREGSFSSDPEQIALGIGVLTREVTLELTPVLPLFITQDGGETYFCAKLERLRADTKNRNLSRRKGVDAGSDARTDAENHASHSHSHSQTNSQPQGAERGANAPSAGKRRRVDGRAELAKALKAAPPAFTTPDLVAACSEYREERSKRRFPPLTAKKWTAYFEKAAGDAVCAAAAFREATLGSWRSVHPKPAQGRTGAQADRQGLHLLQPTPGSPRTLDTEGTVVR